MTSSGWIARCAPSWLLLSLTAAAVLGVGCFPREGMGTVRASFTISDCPPGDDNDGLADFGYDAGFLGTARFMRTLVIQIYEHRSLPEETDGLAIRLDLDALQDAGVLALDPPSGRLVLTASAAEVPVVFDAPGAELNLSLFQTCPEFPTLHGVAGAVRFTALRISDDPEGTGHRERIAATLTASVARGAPLEVVGVVTAEFAFDVPRRPLMTFQ